MKKKIALLGSTGSIGKTLLNIVKKNTKDFEIILLTANKNYKKLLQQTKDFNVRNVIITNKESYEKFKISNKNKKIKIYSDYSKFNKIFKNKIDYAMSSIVGLNGLAPTLKIIKFTKTIAIANKESLICGWNLINKEILKFNTKFIPVDSEHFSIWYAINSSKKNINKIYLTASGGPLLNVPIKNMNKINRSKILKHPKWKMGKKITVDSATMMNKVFEVIEAKNIFGINYKNLSILIHSQSYVHAIVSFSDGMSKIIIHDTTMEIPIFNSIYNSAKIFDNTTKIDVKKLNDLNFKKIDYKKYPVVKILKKLKNRNSLFETVLVSANDELVDQYLKKNISFVDISKILLKILNLKEFSKYKRIIPKKIDDIYKLNEYVRLKIKSICV